MHRLPVVLSAVAILGSILSAVLYFETGNTKKILELRLADADRHAAKLETALASANEKNDSLRAGMGSLRDELAEARGRISAGEAHASSLGRELADAKSVLAVYELTARALADEVAALRRDLADSRASLASPEAVLAYKNTIAELERQLASARNGAAAPSAAGASTAVFTNRPGRATVLTVGPESSFVVLNFGTNRGAQLGQRLTVSQGSADVATVQISDVRANFSVAQVLPDTLRAVLQKGDSALLMR